MDAVRKNGGPVRTLPLRDAKQAEDEEEEEADHHEITQLRERPAP